MSDQPLCLVTGASYGLGYALALNAAERGAHVLALARTQGALDELGDAIDQTKGSVTLIPMDVTNDDALVYLAHSIFERWGRLDYWLHSAWFTAPMQPAPHLGAKDLDKAFQTNIRATAQLIHVLEPIMRQTKGARVVFFDDPDAHGPHKSNIGMSKAAQMEIARNWQQESRRIGPIVEIMTPHPFKSQMRATLHPGEDQGKLSTPANEAVRILDMVMAP